MPFAFSQTQNLSQGTSTRSGIIPIKWGFTSDVDGIDIPSYTRVNNIETSALMLIGEPLSSGFCYGNFGTGSGITSGNNETSNVTVQTEQEWRTLEINPNAKEVKFYVITRAGEGGDVSNNPALRCSGAGVGREDCCDGSADKTQCSSCACVCDGQCTVGGPDGVSCTGTNTCATSYFCCPSPSGNGGDAGYYEVTVNIQNHNQESLWVYLAEFNGNTEISTNDCRDTIKFELYRSTRPFGDPTGAPDMTAAGLYVDFKSYPGQKGSNNSSATQHECNDALPCTDCGLICLPCPPNASDGFDSYFDTPYVNPSLNGSITITVTTKSALDFWGLNGNNGLLATNFGWNPVRNEVNNDFVTKNFGNTGGAFCAPDFVGGQPNPGGAGYAGVCSCEGETFDTDTDDVFRTSGQLVAFEVR